MSDPQDNELSSRLRRLPGQLLLALVNGTAVLVIAAAILAIVASSRITHLAHDVASTMTGAVLSRVGGDARQMTQNLQRVSDDARALAAALREPRAEALARLDPDIARLNERLRALEANIDQLRGVRSQLIDEVIARAGRSLSEGLQHLGVCRREEAQAAHLGRSDVGL